MECYLDNSATTAVSPEAAALALHIMTEEYGNPSSLHRRGFLADFTGSSSAVPARRARHMSASGQSGHFGGPFGQQTTAPSSISA